MGIISVILSGGSGTRLWPLSRPERPKQFLDFGFGATLFALTLRRCSGPTFDPVPIIVAAAAHRELVLDALAAEHRSGEIVLEPMRRDSCAAVVAGALAAAARDPESLVLVVAADHLIPDAEAFRKSVAEATDAAMAGWIVTFGVAPTEPATGYGYIEAADQAVGKTARQLVMFKEKPDRNMAVEYLKRGFLWNSGNFLFKARDFLAEAEACVPDLVNAVRRAFEQGQWQERTVSLDTAAFAEAPRISVDYAIMEKTKKAAVAPVSYVWSDIGSWDAVAKTVATMHPADPGGNIIVGHGFAHGSTNSLLLSDGRLATIAGCDGLVVVVTADSVLVTQKGKTESVKPLVEALERRTDSAESQLPKAETALQATAARVILDAGTGYQLKRFLLAPGQALKRQAEPGRQAIWTVLQGRINATSNGVTKQLTPNASVVAKSLEKLQFKNPGEGEARILELQSLTHASS